MIDTGLIVIEKSIVNRKAYSFSTMWFTEREIMDIMFKHAREIIRSTRAGTHIIDLIDLWGSILLIMRRFMGILSGSGKKSGMWGYKNEGLGWQSIHERYDGHVKILCNDYLSRVIREDEFSKWDTDTPVLVCTPTGTGKTTWVLKSILDHVAKINKANNTHKRVLFVGSRTALLNQFKTDSVNKKKAPANYNQKGGNFPYEVLQSLEGLVKEKQFEWGLVDVISYQALRTKLHEIDVGMYYMVIFDEAHFFTADSTFNCYTGLLLRKLVRKFKSVRRVYITATPRRVISAIVSEESRDCCNSVSIPFKVYAMCPDYGYLKIRFFLNDETIAEIIRKSVASNNKRKWLIFVKSDNQMKKLKTLIGEEDLHCFSAEKNKDGGIECETIVNEGKLVNIVSLSTKVYDVGINIIEKVNIVIYDEDNDERIQMAGRVRKGDGKDRGVLYIKIPKSPFSSMLNYFHILDSNISRAKALSQVIDAGTYSSDILDPSVYIEAGHAKMNHLIITEYEWKAFECVESLEYMLHYMKEHPKLSIDDPEAQREAYVHYILDQFPGIDCSSTLIVDQADKSELKKTADKMYDELCRKEFTTLEEVQKLLCDDYGLARDTRRENRRTDRNDYPGVNLINQQLKEYGYKIVHNPKNKTYFIDAIL